MKEFATGFGITEDGGGGIGLVGAIRWRVSSFRIASTAVVMTLEGAVIDTLGY